MKKKPPKCRHFLSCLHADGFKYYFRFFLIDSFCYFFFVFFACSSSTIA
jgi:hypothetical protein